MSVSLSSTLRLRSAKASAFNRLFQFRKHLLLPQVSHSFLQVCKLLSDFSQSRRLFHSWLQPAKFRIHKFLLVPQGLDALRVLVEPRFDLG